MFLRCAYGSSLADIFRKISKFVLEKFRNQRDPPIISIGTIVAGNRKL